MTKIKLIKIQLFQVTVMDRVIFTKTEFLIRDSGTRENAMVRVWLDGLKTLFTTVSGKTINVTGPVGVSGKISTPTKVTGRREFGMVSVT